MHLLLYWSSTYPDSTLKKIGECVSKITLRTLMLVMNMPSGEVPVVEERSKEWLQCVEVGGKELIQSLEDSHLQTLYFAFHYTTKLRLNLRQQSHQLDQLRQALDAMAATVNTARRQKGLPDIYYLYLGIS